MRCDDFADRLYDEDATRALRAGIRPPADMQAHLRSCGDCALLWREVGDEAEWLPVALAAEPTPELEARVLAAARSALPPRSEPLLDWTTPALWATCGASLAACGVLLTGGVVPGSWSPLLVLGGAGLAFVTEVALQGLEATRA